MVQYDEILASNALINDATGLEVAVFVGGTSGIGKATIEALVETGASCRIYLVGRATAEERMRPFIAKLHQANPKAEIVWTEGNVSLLSDVKRVCDIIKSKESKINLLFLSAGYAPLGGRIETAEGLDISQCLEYYSRILFTLHFLPRLENVGNARVVSVLAGGIERKQSIDVLDLDLKKPGYVMYLVKSQMQFGAMGTLTLDRLANEHKGITFIHSWPGIVPTGNERRGAEPVFFWRWFSRLVMGPLIRLIGDSETVAGQRYLFQCSSALFGGNGVSWSGEMGLNSRARPTQGVFLVNYKCDCTPNTEVVSFLREQAQEELWRHTQEVLRPYL